MSVEPIRGKGVCRALARCDVCKREETVTCKYSRGGGPGKGFPDKAQVHFKLCQHGWSVIKETLRCPKCETERKAKNMTKKTKPDKNLPLRQPTRAEKRKILDMLNSCYDTEGERYLQGDTDDSVASVLNVMPGWVAQMREELFGPAGGNEEIEKLATDLAELREQVAAQIRAGTDYNNKLIEMLERAKNFSTQLDQIKKAVGPRILQRGRVSG